MSRSSPTSRRSFSVPNSSDRHNSRRPLYEESFSYEKESDILDIDNIDHDAIQNDTELRGNFYSLFLQLRLLKFNYRIIAKQVRF